jgi:glycosyltransferase involved in cell wall biosynthesis
MQPKTVSALHIQRKANQGQFSIEGYFERVREFSDGRVEMTAHTVPHFSKGLSNRLINCRDCRNLKAHILHVTGDIHYVAPFLRGKNRVLTIHDCHILHQLPWPKRVIVKLLWFTIPARFLDHITVNSNTTKQQVLDTIRFPEHKITVIPVSVSRILPPGYKEFNTEKPTILQVGTKPNKNLPRLAEALQGITCNLEIVGKLTPELTSILDKYKIQYSNFVNLTEMELAERYANCDIVAFASLHEGFGMPIVEAQLAHKPCLTSNLSSMPETAGEGAFFVDPYSTDSIRAGILKLIADATLRRQLVESGKHNCERFCPKRISAMFTELYLALLDRENSRPY